MGEKYLFEIFLEKEVLDLQKVILTYGIHGLMANFENWLHRYDALNDDKVLVIRKSFDSGELL